VLLTTEPFVVIFGVGLFLFATAIVYAARCATVGAQVDEFAHLRGPSLFPSWLRSWWRWLCSPFVRACLRLGIPAQAVATAGVIASAAAGIAVMSRALGSGGGMYLAAASLAGIGTEIARIQGTPGRAAALVDGALGRLAELLMLGALAYAVRHDEAALATALCAIAATMLASDARLRSEALGAALPNRAGWFGRSERALLIGAPCAIAPAADLAFYPGAGLDVLAAALGLAGVLGAFSAFRRIHTGREVLRTIDALSTNPQETGRRFRLVRGGRA
jgi:hypothetical protein